MRLSTRGAVSLGDNLGYGCCSVAHSQGFTIGRRILTSTMYERTAERQIEDLHRRVEELEIVIEAARQLIDEQANVIERLQKESGVAAASR